jgi:hypothetical protein
MLTFIHSHTFRNDIPTQVQQPPQAFAGGQPGFAQAPDARYAHAVFAQLPQAYPPSQGYTQGQQAQVQAQVQAHLYSQGWTPSAVGSFCFTLPAPAVAPTRMIQMPTQQMPTFQMPVSHRQAPHVPVAQRPALSLLRSIPCGVDYEQLGTGEPLHQGKSRDLYPVLSPSTGAPTGQVLVVERSRRADFVHREVEVLARLNELGFPVVAIQSCGNFDDRAARLMPQLEPVDIEYGGIQQSPNVTAATIACLQRILYLMDTQNIRIQGLQLLMNPEDGNVYISGARTVNSSWTGDPRTGQMRPYTSSSREYLVEALNALQLRAAQPQN